MAKKQQPVTTNKNRKANARKAGLVLAAVALFLAGILASVKYQSVINHIEAQGVKEYKAEKCAQYDRDGASWVECEVKESK